MKIMDTKSIIRHYRRRHLLSAIRELGYFRNLPDLNTCIQNAALAKNYKGKRYRHQSRISKKTLSIAKDTLLNNKEQIKEMDNFDKLFALIDNLLKPVNGIGPLYIYDTSLRIGSFLGYLPEKVYLHADTSTGARKLGFKNPDSIEMSEFTNEFQYLEPFEVEDILCIYK
jgi:hypothetical protein